MAKEIDHSQFPFWCPKCDVTFLTPTDLEHHLQRIHHHLTAADKELLRSMKITPWEDDE